MMRTITCTLILLFVISINFNQINGTPSGQSSGVEGALRHKSRYGLARLTKQFDESGRLRQIIDGAELNGVLDPSNVVHEFIQDPFPVEPFSIDKPLDGNFSAMEVIGLRQLKVNRMRVNLGLMRLDVSMLIPNLRLTGEYTLEGKIALFPIRGGGPFQMNISELEITASANLKRNVRHGHIGQIQVDDIDLDVEHNGIDLHFENLGSKRMSIFMNSVLNKLSNLIFEQMKHMILSTTEQDIKKQLDQELRKLPETYISGRSEHIFNDLLANIKNAIVEQSLDPFVLPNTTESFRQDLLLFTFYGDLRLFNGIIYGPSTLIRTSNLIATYENDSVTLEAQLGFDNLTGTFDWSASLMDAGPAGTASLHVSQISAYIKIKQNLKEGSAPKLESFKIEKIKYLWVKIRGLGTLDFLIELFVNLISNVFKRSLTAAIEGPISELAQREFDQFPLSFI